jgi:peptide/nickel transport system substrate-binding protein
MMSTKNVVSMVARHFVETLYTVDANWGVALLLATELPTISADGLTSTIGLRDDITFHDVST